MSQIDPNKTLPDYIRPGLDILSVGINPGRVSAERGFVFAHPRNRFWPAFNAAQIVPEVLTPSVKAVEKLYTEYNIGFTDVVPRPTPQANDLSAADWRDGAPLLLEKLERAQPRIAWFHGKLALGNFLRYTRAIEASGEWGLQTFEIGHTKVFLTPSPSPANASFSLDTLVAYYRELKVLRDRLVKE
ncbi:MAG TPA: mismatch-specific DNA-glycosylase [Burkholderiales bacterium]|nr:mismatch-specific DNA-glycosylase [Burkholderiales bacterium]